MGITNSIFIKELFCLDLTKSEFFHFWVFYATFGKILHTKYLKERHVLQLNR